MSTPNRPRFVFLAALRGKTSHGSRTRSRSPRWNPRNCRNSQRLPWRAQRLGAGVKCALVGGKFWVNGHVNGKRMEYQRNIDEHDAFFLKIGTWDAILCRWCLLCRRICLPSISAWIRTMPHGSKFFFAPKSPAIHHTLLVHPLL